MKRNKDADRSGRRAKDLKGKKLSVSQQAAVKGGFADGSRNRLLLPAVLPAEQLHPTSKAVSP